MSQGMRSTALEWDRGPGKYGGKPSIVVDNTMERYRSVAPALFH